PACAGLLRLDATDRPPRARPRSAGPDPHHALPPDTRGVAPPGRPRRRTGRGRLGGLLPGAGRPRRDPGTTQPGRVRGGLQLADRPEPDRPLEPEADGGVSPPARARAA